ncbi:hypothetical protein HYT25_01060 [Candidatus Pacearchaeota archaeon]|nr:hypothetical protein [Candidatus Pacearchaeota archaeon]
MHKLLRRMLTGFFFFLGLLAFFVFAKNAGDINQLAVSLWSLFLFSVSFTIVLVLNH